MTENIITDILNELSKAQKKFPNWPHDPLHAVAVVGEEYGELTREMLQLVYEPHKSSREKVREEAIQCAAMCLRLLISLDQYEYKPAPQHQQETAPLRPPEQQLLEAKEDAARYRTHLDEEKTARAACFKELEAVKYRLSVAALDVVEVQAALGYGADEELWKPGTTIGESVAALVAERTQLQKQVDELT